MPNADHTPRRIVCLQPSATVILDRLGFLDRVVACTRWCGDLTPAARDGSRAVVHDSWTATGEEIAAARPDLVIASVPYQVHALGEILKAGARFLGLAPRRLEDVYADIAMLAGVMHVPQRGLQIITEMGEEIERVRARVSSRSRPRVWCEEWGKPLIGSQLWVAELVEAAGGEFMGEPRRRTTAVEVAAAEPEVVVAAWCGAGDRVPLEKMVRERGWERLPAGRSGRVFCVRDEYLNTPAPTLLHGLHALAAAIHPEVFPEAAGLRRMAPRSSPGRPAVAPTI